MKLKPIVLEIENCNELKEAIEYSADCIKLLNQYVAKFQESVEAIGKIELSIKLKTPNL